MGLLKSILIMFTVFALTATASAKGTEKLETFKNVDNPFLRTPKKLNKTARIRVGMRLNPYEKIVVRDTSGKRKVSFKTSLPLKNYLRARFDKTNHFYMDQWRVETRPLSWDKQRKD